MSADAALFFENFGLSAGAKILSWILTAFLELLTILVRSSSNFVADCFFFLGSEDGGKYSKLCTDTEEFW